MTTIVVDAKNRKVYADKQTTGTRWFTKDPSTKTYTYELTEKLIKGKFENDHIITGCGDKGEIQRQAESFEYADRLTLPKKDCTVIIVKRRGGGLVVDIYDAVKDTSWKWWRKYKWEHKRVFGEDFIVTAGSGGNYAYGAIKAGVSVEDAIRAASLCDPYTSPEFDVEEL